MTLAPPVLAADSLSAIESAVVAENVSRRYGSGDAAVDAVRHVSVTVEPGELVAVMGPSGSGKSTLMHMLAGLDRPTEGRIRIAGQDLTALGDNALTLLRRRHIGFIFQFFNLLPMLTAYENIVLPQNIAGEKPERAWVDELVRTEAEERKHGIVSLQDLALEVGDKDRVWRVLDQALGIGSGFVQFPHVAQDADSADRPTIGIAQGRSIQTGGDYFAARTTRV